jgi:hypothetical protein
MPTAADKLLVECEKSLRGYLAKVEALHEAEHNEETESVRRAARQALRKAGLSLAKARSRFRKAAEAEFGAPVMASPIVTAGPSSSSAEQPTATGAAPLGVLHERGTQRMARGA